MVEQSYRRTSLALADADEAVVEAERLGGGGEVVTGPLGSYTHS